MIRLLAVLLLLLASPALADSTTGIPRIVDGDSLVINGVKVRLHGIDAPERNQTCGTEPNRWDCGRQSSRALSKMIDRAPVTCHERDVDRYGRIVAVCSVGGVLLNARMVAEGWAVAYRQYSMDYVGEEDQAREGGRGIWSGEFVRPEDWRRGQRTARSRAAPSQSPRKMPDRGSVRPNRLDVDAHDGGF
ncbi:MAG: thermonuclease family protein [Alphaproteobacteria bacterium]|nr:thermonuclease family protein [Alphaproteobacteria bacterium]